MSRSHTHHRLALYFLYFPSPPHSRTCPTSPPLPTHALAMVWRQKELKAVKKPTDMGLAVALVKHVQVLSVHGLSNMIDNWKDEQVCLCLVALDV